MARMLAIPVLIGAACLLIFKDVLDTLVYVQLIRYAVFVIGVIVVIGNIMDFFSKEK